MTSKNLILVTDTRLDELTVVAVCKHNIATADTTPVVGLQQAAKTSEMSSCVDRIVEMLVSGPVKKTNCTTGPQHIVQVEFGPERMLLLATHRRMCRRRLTLR